MKAAMISGNSKSSQWTVEAMRKYFDEVDHLYIKYVDINFSGKKAEVLYKGEPVKKYDCVFVKGSFRYAQLLRAISDLFIMDSSIFLPISPDAFTIAHDKLLTQLVLQQKNIPMPKTYLSATIDAAKELLRHMTYPVIMKFPQGTQGKGVMFADSFSSASSILDALDALNQPFIIQEFVDTGNTDLRLIVVGDKVVAAMRRIAKPDEVRANFHQGGTMEKYEPDDNVKKLAVETAQAIGADICGVDILESPKGPLVLEANISPGLQGITRTTKIDIADLIAKYLFERTKQLVDSQRESKAKNILEDLDIKDSLDKSKELISQLDFRGDRILLPKVISRIAGFSESDSVKITAEKGRVTLEKFM